MTRKNNDCFIYEYLYIEEPPLIFIDDFKNPLNNKTDETARGYEVIVLFGDEEK